MNRPVAPTAQPAAQPAVQPSAKDTQLTAGEMAFVNAATPALAAALDGCNVDELQALLRLHNGLLGRATYYQGNTLAHLAVVRGNLACLRAVVEAGSVLNQRNENGVFPVELALKYKAAFPDTHSAVSDYLSVATFASLCTNCVVVRV